MGKGLKKPWQTYQQEENIPYVGNIIDKRNFETTKKIVEARKLLDQKKKQEAAEVEMGMKVGSIKTGQLDIFGNEITETGYVHPDLRKKHIKKIREIERRKRNQ